jgi:acyl phosphate:glycerol-3-phosphate acyltransferase
VAITRYSSAGSMIASFSGIVFAIAMQREWWKVVMLILIFVLILWTHRDNLKRLAAGNERQFNQRSVGVVPSDTAPAETVKPSEETKL